MKPQDFLAPTAKGEWEKYLCIAELGFTLKKDADSLQQLGKGKQYRVTTPAIKKHVTRSASKVLASAGTLCFLYKGVSFFTIFALGV